MALKEFIQAAEVKYDANTAQGVIASAKQTAAERFINGLDDRLFYMFYPSRSFETIQEAIKAAEEADKGIQMRENTKGVNTSKILYMNNQENRSNFNYQ